MDKLKYIIEIDFSNTKPYFPQIHHLQANIWDEDIVNSRNELLKKAIPKIDKVIVKHKIKESLLSDLALIALDFDYYLNSDEEGISPKERKEYYQVVNQLKELSQNDNISFDSISLKAKGFKPIKLNSFLSNTLWNSAFRDSVLGFISRYNYPGYRKDEIKKGMRLADFKKSTEQLKSYALYNFLANNTQYRPDQTLKNDLTFLVRDLLVIYGVIDKCSPKENKTKYNSTTKSKVQNLVAAGRKEASDYL